MSIARVDSAVLEEGVGSISLTCRQEGNPPGRVSWRRAGDRAGPHNTEQLEFSPVRRENSGTWSCVATNSVGRSDPATTIIDVLCKYL